MKTCRASCAERFGPEPERARQEVGLEDRLEHDLHRRLHDPVTDRGIDSGRCSSRSGLRDEHPARRQRPPTPLPQFRGQLVEQPGNPVLLDIGDGGPVDARCAVDWRAPPPTPAPRRPCGRPCHKRVEPSSGIGLGRPVKRMLQGTDRSMDPAAAELATNGTHRALPYSMTHQRSSGPSLTGGCVVRSARSVLRPPPTPTRHRRPLPGSSPVIGRAAPTSIRRPPGRGGPPQFPPSPIRTFRAPYAGESFGGCTSRIFTASMAFALIGRARLPLPSSGI